MEHSERLLPRIRRQLDRLRADQAGNVLAMAAAGMLVGAALIGGGLDMSRAYMVKTELQAACDAGVLAGRKAVDTNGFDTGAQDAANEYFSANFAENGSNARGTQFDATSDDNGNTVNGVATTTVDSTVMRIFGKNVFPLSVNCTASMGVGNSDVTMVLDTTGSMDDYLSGTRKIDALRAAMKNFYTTVHAATAGTNARVRYAFVPYSSSINVGHLIYDLNPDYLVDSYAIQSREPVYTSVTSDQFDHWDTPVTTTGSGTSRTSYGSWQRYGGSSYYSSWSCNNDLPSNAGFTNSGASSTSSDTSINSSGQQVTTTTVSQPQTATEYGCGFSYSSWRYEQYSRTVTRTQYSYTYDTSNPVNATVTHNEFDHFTYKQVTYDTSAYKTFSSVTTPTGNNGADQSSTWAGCIEERATIPNASFSWSSLTGMSPSGATDLDIDTPPDTSDNATKWAPMWPEVAYYRTSWVSSRWGGGYQISDVATSDTGQKANSYCPVQARLLAQMDESDFDDYADSLHAEGSTYHDLGMIWGGRISSPDGMWSSLVNEAPANGGSVSRHIIFMTDGQMQPSYSIQSAYGIEFHDRRVTDDGSTDDATRHTARFEAVCDEIKSKGIRIWVIAFSSGLSTALQNCASDDSAFTANDADQLNSAFQEIAKQVGELRVTT